MREILDDVRGWQRDGRRVALATVVGVHRSAPRQPGAVMAVSDAGEIAGNVSGGCVEAAVFEQAQAVLQTGEPVLVRYGISDEDAASVGLTCGGEIDVFIERLDW